MPERALDLLRAEPAYGVRLEGRRWSGGLHVDFEIVPSFVEPDAKLAELESKGLDAAVVSVAPPLFYYHLDAEEAGEAMSRATNEGLAEFCESDPERLRWLATVPMQAPDRAVAVLSEAVAAGAVGVEIGTAVAGRRLDEPDFEPFWSAAERLGIPVTLHPGIRRAQPCARRLLLRERPRLPVRDHDHDRAADRRRRPRPSPGPPAGPRSTAADTSPTRSVAFATPARSGPNSRTRRPTPGPIATASHFDIITHDPSALAYLIERAGADRVVMGTDLPFDMATPIRSGLLEAAAGDDAARRSPSATRAALYGFPTPA